MRTRLIALTVCLLLGFAGAQARQNRSVLASPPFESYLEALRAQAGIPGLSAAIVLEGEVVWERGFGFQNLESRIRATPDTPYPVADLSQTLAAVLLLQCVEGRRLGLDDPVRLYGVTLPEGDATLRQVLSHTSTGNADDAYRYDSERYAALTDLMVACAPQPYRKSVSHRILERLAMVDSVPGLDLRDPNVVPPGLYDPSHLERYVHVLERLAVPYRIDRRRRATRTDVPVEGINAATGLVSTVRDLARFDAALDTYLLLDDTRALAWTPRIVGERQQPTGLGWFVQPYNGELVVWHFGLIPNAYSSLILKIPQRKLTLILLANSDGLTAPFQLQQGDVTRSLFATLFLRLFL